MEKLTNVTPVKNIRRRTYVRKNFKLFLILWVIFFSSPLFAQHEQHVDPTHTSAPPAAKKFTPMEHETKAPKAKKQLALAMKPISISRGVDRTVNLVIGYKWVNFAGKWRQAIATNNQIPAPTLHFKEGDHVTINVYNHLNIGTAIHWHGIILPWQMDGVEGITQQPIPTGGVFHYQFTLHQAGTYWYHAHAEVQEQEGLYGAFIIDPPQSPHYQYSKDYVVVLSDWSNTTAKQVLANLKKEGDYYSPKFPLQPSLMKFIHDYRKATLEERKKLIDDYKMMQQMRMSIYDLSDVAYDAYLLNGKTPNHPWVSPVKIGDIVRLRFIGAAGSTIYRVKIPNAKMKMVHVQGNNVKPYTIDDFTIAPGETYDVLVKIKENKPYIIYAESIDTRGVVIGALVTNLNQRIDYKSVTPFPEPEPVTREMMSTMMMSGMDHSSMGMNRETPTLNTDKGSSPHAMMEHDSQTMDKPSSTMKMDPETVHNMKRSMSQEAMKDTVEMDPSMKMDGNIPMDHSMHMNHKNPITSTTTDKKSRNLKTNDGVSTSRSAPTKQENSHNMSSMSQGAIANTSASHAGHSTRSGNTMKMSGDMKTDPDMIMNHSMNMDMPTEPTIIGDTISPPNSSKATTAGTKYQNLIAAVKTNDPNKPINGIIKMELFGYMDRFIWFINGLPEYKVHPIHIKPGKRYRIIFTNNSMMRHPMHIHGHWFILRNGHGDHDPLLHTIEVPPGATAVADVDTDASGQWFFHCHHLYHMMTGMSRVFQYSTLIDVIKGVAKPENEISQQAYVNRPIVRVDEQVPMDSSLVNHPMAHPMGLYLANFLNVGEDPFNNAQRATFKGLYGSDYNKLELFSDDAEISKGTIENADLDIFYWHLINQFWAIKGGANYFYRPGGTPYWQPGIGIEGLMPYFIDTDVRAYYHDSSAKLDAELSRDTQITNNFFIRIGIRTILATKTVTQDEIGNGLNQMRYIIRPYYRLMPGLTLFTEFEHEKDYGALKSIRRNAGESTSEKTLTFGLSILF